MCQSIGTGNDDGKINTEPGSSTGYVRKLITYPQQNISGDFQVNGGKIYNRVELQFNSAKADYPKDIKYWFISSSPNLNEALMWGEIKQVLFSGKENDEPTITNEDNCIFLTWELNDPFSLAENQEYIIHWGKNEDNKIMEYKSTAYTHTLDGIQYTCIGNANLIGEANQNSDEKLPFFIKYNIFIEPTTNVTKGTISFIQPNTEPTMSKQNINLFQLGINVKKATVPTFYAEALQASIDEELVQKNYTEN